MRRYRLKYLHRSREITQFTVGADSISARFISVKPFVHGPSGTPVPTVYGGYHSFYRNRVAKAFPLGKVARLAVTDEVSAHLFWLNHSPRRTTKGRPYGYGGYRSFHRSRGVTQFTVGADSISARLFWLNRSYTGQIDNIRTSYGGNRFQAIAV